MQLTGAVAVVTGAGRGIGAATTRLLVRRGATVVALGHRADEIEAITAETGATPLVADVRDPDHARLAMDIAVRRHGRLDAVVANAGIGHYGDVAEMSTERIDDLVATNVRAPMLLARAALPSMLEQRRGALVFVTSIAGILLVPHESVYSASKAALEAFAGALRQEVRGNGVTVSTVLPGVVDTGFFDDRGAAYQRERPRPQPPERVAKAIVRAVERGDDRLVVPPWFRLPIAVRGAAPGLYERLARRFG
ncbi:MAG: SDR family NAD(P)-dependent oxidoreductase [Frankiales bacterium]|nr:SDR family NAD(P)-dependent oxidoreductase [Frankiales bacterium]